MLLDTKVEQCDGNDPCDQCKKVDQTKVNPDSKWAGLKCTRSRPVHGSQALVQRAPSVSSVLNYTIGMICLAKYASNEMNRND